MNPLEWLLSQVASINLKYQKIEEAAKTSFNIFAVLRADADEVRLHSNFIAELLDPRGSHKLGDLFQILFFETLDGPQQSHQAFPVVQREVSGTHGRIDILMRGKCSGLVIENKIYAPDPPKQLQRYYEFLKSRYPQGKRRLLYLTLFGTPPSNESRGNVPRTEIEPISYSRDILNWLERCAQASYQIPHLRESLIQYISLVKKLTGQTISEDHKMEITNLLLEGDHLESALTLENALTEAKIEVQRLVWQDLLQELSLKGYVFNPVDNVFTKKDLASYCKNFYAPQKRAKNYGIEYKVADYDDYSVHLHLSVDHNLCYGFTAAKRNERGEYVRGPYAQEVTRLHPWLQDVIAWLTEWKGIPGNGWAFAWRHTDPRVNFRNFHEAYAAKLANPDERKKWVGEVTAELIRLIVQFRAEEAKIANERPNVDEPLLTEDPVSSTLGM
ncbi:PD-(D/E)XK nuclease family protein [Candidatus Thiodictyon syntrophicum]|jgi:hypothetical protein|uniref:PD-(D/E)XK nuclease superfamily protein n=1 Tax=Candidatus Thiodictyon syntrophicum TaxID=1166950 RepID=A0A2K8UC43_9GAMM|nr:PD-(D/E)XK nuclease family protein [Candidatus Thiodictyon syntrophicum]AUB83164.1 hypothetical protein THSYN_20945 [Candidatus Thiodictyon syntrophicum]